MNAAEKWAVAAYSTIARDLPEAIRLVQEIPEQTFKTEAGAVDPVDALAALHVMLIVVHENAITKPTDEDINVNCALLVVSQRLQELRPSLEDFVGLRTIKGIYRGGVIGIDDHFYRFFGADAWERQPVGGRVGNVKISWLRTIRRLSIEEMHVMDLVAVVHQVNLVIEMRLHEAGPTKILYGVDEKTDRLILEVGTIHDPTIKIKHRPGTRFVFACNSDGIDSVRPTEIVDENVDEATATG